MRFYARRVRKGSAIMSKLLIKNALVVDPSQALEQTADLLIEDGLIAAIGPGLSGEGAQVIEAAGLVAIPGLVDMHVHLRDPGQTHKEDILSGSEASAAGGFTSVACMPNTVPTVDSPETVRYIVDKAKDAKARVYPIASVTKGLSGGELCDYAALKAAGAVAVSDDGKPVKNAAVLQEAMARAMDAGLPVISHCEDLDIIAGGIVNKGAVSEALGLPGMDRTSEDSITAREIAIAAATGTRIHIAHVSTRGSAALIRDAKRRGVPVTAETCPHYFTLTQDKLLSRDADYRMNPPLREEADRLAILDALCDGVFDCITTDHAPHTADEKADFTTAPNGVVGLETSLAVTLTMLYHTGKLPLSDIIWLMSESPASLLDIPGGDLRVGGPADLVLVDLEREWVVTPDELRSRSHNTPFKGMTLKGRPVLTVCGGLITHSLL